MLVFVKKKGVRPLWNTIFKFELEGALRYNKLHFLVRCFFLIIQPVKAGGQRLKGIGLEALPSFLTLTATTSEPISVAVKVCTNAHGTVM